MRDWLQRATGIELNDTVDMFCARYEHTDYLSCHDDELEGRRIAYIFYLGSYSMLSWDLNHSVFPDPYCHLSLL